MYGPGDCMAKMSGGCIHLVLGHISDRTRTATSEADCGQRPNIVFPLRALYAHGHSGETVIGSYA
jgi:hypothetical protein